MFKRKVRRLCELMVQVNLLDPDFHGKLHEIEKVKELLKERVVERN